jgi:hypothetical protein
VETAVIVAILSAAASILVASVSFYFAKKKDQEADWRKIKFEHYREFMTALSSIVGPDATSEGLRRFAHACNTVQLIASKSVIVALHEFREGIATPNRERTRGTHDQLLSSLVREIRADLGVLPESNPADLSIRLWASGVTKD